MNFHPEARFYFHFVLWALPRASVSSIPALRMVLLGPYGNRRKLSSDDGLEDLYNAVDALKTGEHSRAFTDGMLEVLDEIKP